MTFVQDRAERSVYHYQKLDYFSGREMDSGIDSGIKFPGRLFLDEVHADISMLLGADLYVVMHSQHAHIKTI